MTERCIEPRRLPTQDRGRERVDRILDAAARLLVEQGYEAVKTNHIAKRAGVSVGSIYQFFPNRVARVMCAMGRVLLDYSMFEDPLHHPR
ncbi:MAG: helix-turn-helix domain-containing protein [Candidatus Hydrogenedentota bacterium]